jgi:hypothetical protein
MLIKINSTIKQLHAIQKQLISILTMQTFIPIVHYPILI